MSSFAPPEGVPSSAPLSDLARSESPEAPPYSPITPVLQEASVRPSSSLFTVPPKPMEVPPTNVPISETTNSDAIALRATLSVLQLQRLQSMRHLETLERQKKEAVADPEQFARDLSSGKVRSTKSRGVLGLAEKLPRLEMAEGVDDPMFDSDEKEDLEQSSFGLIPTPQNIVRCPPINWAKYHVAGEALDRLHEEQRLNPSSGVSQVDQALHPPLHLIAAPYSPWRDKLPESSMRTRSVGRKG